MNLKKLLTVFACVVLAVGAFAADKLAVTEPVGKGGVPAADIEAFWGILESSIQSDEYTLVSRGALKQMLTEIGLTTSSDLVSLNSTQKAKLGEVEGVKYILVSEISKFGSRLNCTMRILDATTGEIDQARTANIRVKDLDELADQIEATLQKLLADDKALHRSAILAPVIKVTAPSYLADDFNVRLENEMLDKGLRLQNLQSVAKILKKNDMDNLNEIEPKLYVKAGKLLEVEMLIQATITRFEIDKIAYNVAETGASGFRYIGNIEGSVRIISAQTGETLGSVPFDERVDFRTIPISTRRDWTVDDYGKHLIRTVIPQKVIPGIMKAPAFKDMNPPKTDAEVKEAPAEKPAEAMKPPVKETAPADRPAPKSAAPAVLNKRSKKAGAPRDPDLTTELESVIE